MASASPAILQPELVTAEPSARAVAQFGSFEVNFEQWEIRKRGIRIRLQRKPFQILRLLVERNGELVTRSELARALWPELHVDYERSLNTAVNSLRQALSDCSRTYRYIETCPGLGYRFIAPVIRSVHSPKTSEAKNDGEAEFDNRRGQFFLHKMTAESLARAIPYFESACRLNPGDPLPQAGLADVHNLLAAWSFSPTKRAARDARACAEAALRIDPQCAEAQTALATSYRWIGVPDPDVERRYAQALSRKNCLSTRLWYGDFLCSRARFDEAQQQIAEAQQIDSVSLLSNYQAAWLRICLRDFDGAVEQSWKTLALEPTFAPAQYTLGLAYEQQGMWEEALTEFDNARRCSAGHPCSIAALVHTYGRVGNTAEAERAFDDLRRLEAESFVSAYWLAIACVGLGQWQRAAAFLEQAHADGDCLVQWLAIDPRLQRLASCLTVVR